MKGKNWAWIAGAVMMTGVLFLFSCQSSQFNRGKYAIIMKSRNNWYNELASEGFKQTVEDAGKNCIVLYPDHPSAQEQIHLIQNLIDEKVEAIAVAANDEYALTPVLTQAREKGISVITLDADVEAGSRSIYISPVDARELGKELVREVDRICGHSGQWGILSAGSRSANQNEWIYMMKQELQNLEYRDLRLVDIAYGEGEYEKAAEKANLMLETYPDLKVMCCLSTEGIKAAADVVKARGQASEVKVIGLGLPDQMEDYVGSDPEDVCPVLYIWNPMDLGRVAGYVCLELSEGRIEERGDQELLLGGRTYPMDYGHDGGLEVIAGEPIKVDSENIGYWKDQI